jgi:imidazolonepropionase-like amidohydrolase
MTNMRARLIQKLTLATIVLGIAGASVTVAQTPTAPKVIALVGGTVVNVENGSSIPNAVVLVEGERIKAVGRVGSVTVPAGAVTVPMHGSWLIPGLMNMHVHLGLNLPGAAQLVDEPDGALSLRMLSNAQQSLYSGVTTIRVPGDHGHGVNFAVQHAIENGVFDGPRIHNAGEPIAPTAGHGDLLFADGPWEVAKAVRMQIARGATWIKLGISGGISDVRGAINASTMTSEEMRVAVDIAHRNGLKVTVHSGSPLATSEAIDAGIDCVEHGYFFDEPVLQKMKSKGIWYVPTIVVSQKGAMEYFQKIGSPPWYLERQASVGKAHWKALQTAIRLGLKIALGTDQMPYEPNEGTTATIREAELYAEAGMTSLAALQAATIQAARLLEVESEVGTVAVGKYADIVAVTSDPSQNIRALRTIHFVMKGGKIVRNDPEGGKR